MKKSEIEKLLKELKTKKSKLITKAFKQFPQSPLQMKTRKEIDETSKKINYLENKLKK